jgi:NADPH:quinone reductase
MKAICVTPDRDLYVRDIPTPTQPAPGHVLIDIDGSAINHGDKTFLRMPTAAGPAFAAAQHDVWGVSGAGRVIAIGDGVPGKYLGKQVAAYRSLRRTPDMIGLWSERAHVHFLSCLILPDHVQAVDYSGSLVNVMTAYAFLEEAIDAGHRGVIVTAGNSATGYALAALARRRNIPSILLARTEAAKTALINAGVEHVILMNEGFVERLGVQAAELSATAVFEGVGGLLPGQIAPCLPMHSTMYLYGVLAGPTPFTMPSALIMMKDLTVRRFSNFESTTVKDSTKLQDALIDLENVIEDPLFRTNVGTTFAYEDIEQAMTYEGAGGYKAILRN